MNIPMMIALITLSMGCSWAATVHCPATRDASVSFHNDERNTTQGTKPTIKLKYFEEFGLVDFDVQALKGQKIKEAWLVVKAAGGHKYDLNKGTDLRWISVSTVAEDWDEASVCANASGKRQDWGFPGARGYDVVLGHSYTLRCNGTLEPANGWHRMRLDPALVKALVAGVSYGLFLADGSSHYNLNCRIASRESKANAPYLEVETEGTSSGAPGKPQKVQASAAPNSASTDKGAIRLRFETPKDAFAFKVEVDGQAVPRRLIPLANPGSTQEIVIEDLTPKKQMKISIAAVGETGTVGSGVELTATSSPALTVPAIPASTWKPVGGTPPKLGDATVWAFPEVTKVSPKTGLVILEKGAEGYAEKNPVWDGATKAVWLAAAKGEIVSFQVALDGAVSDVKVGVSDLSGPGSIKAGKAVRLWRNWYIGEQSDYLLPLTGAFGCPMADNGLVDQKHQALTVDIAIPQDAKPGLYKGTVSLNAGSASLELGLSVKVFAVSIPDEINFNPELNCYSGPGEAGSDQFKESFKIAHYNRCTINRVPYNQSGRVHEDWSPSVDGKGKVTDWARFDRNLAGLLDGTLFKDNPRSGVPVPTLYLPVFEGWPLDFKKHYNPGDGISTDVPSLKSNKDGHYTLLIRHQTLAKPCEEAFSKEYKDAWKACVTSFYDHAKDKKWNRTAFQCYLNNKPNYGYTMWTLDEPTIYRDWEALNFFGKMWKDAIADPEVYTREWLDRYYETGLSGMKRTKPVFLFRGDISRPEWQGNLSDGLMNIIYISGAANTAPRASMRQKRDLPAIAYNYGGASGPTKNNWTNVAWCQKAFVDGYDGVLPWQSLGQENEFRNGEKGDNGNALIVNAGSFGSAVPSTRLASLRRGAQDSELLRLLQLRNGWSRAHVEKFVKQKLPLSAEVRTANADVVVAHTFGELSSQDFYDVKEGVLQLLAKSETKSP
jgi:hypothetical protein